MAASRTSLDWLVKPLAALERRGLRRRLGVHDAGQGGLVWRDGRQLVNFGANDYLGLAAHPALAAAAREAIDQFGWGAAASPLVTGRTSMHAELERRLAEFEGAEAALVFPSGFAANAGTIPALAGPGDAIFSDAKNHASLIDGCRLSRALSLEYPHGDMATLERLLDENKTCRRRLIVTDTLFSMDGDVAPLVPLAKLAEQHDAMLLVDEAHATGVWGPSGRGLVEHFAAANPIVERAVAIRIGTLSKALGCSGGFVVGSQKLIDYLTNRARSYVYSTAAPAANSAAALAALELIRDEPQRRQRVLALADLLRSRLAERGWRFGDSQSQIVPVILGDVERTVRVSQRLLEQGMLVPAIRPPTVPQGEALLRVSLSAAHSEEQVERLAEALGTCS